VYYYHIAAILKYTTIVTTGRLPSSLSLPALTMIDTADGEVDSFKKRSRRGTDGEILSTPSEMKQVIPGVGAIASIRSCVKHLIFLRFLWLRLRAARGSPDRSFEIRRNDGRASSARNRLTFDMPTTCFVELQACRNTCVFE
jgi:hypothetical protein